MRAKDRWGTKEKPDANKSTGGRVGRNKEERESRRLSDCNMALGLPPTMAEKKGPTILKRVGCAAR